MNKLLKHSILTTLSKKYILQLSKNEVLGILKLRFKIHIYVPIVLNIIDDCLIFHFFFKLTILL